VIGEVGSTGRVTGSHLHLEIRKGNVAQNPLYYLPSL
jgi:murein DD-endopeptidase MepM/ murein hydrolase activator NlpD